MADLVKGWDAPVISAAADAEGRIVATSYAPAAASLAACLDSLRALPEWSAGDVAITNDVYYGSSHPTEITAAAPVIQGGRIIGWTLLRTDLPDIGGWELGSYSPQALDIWSEGARIVPAKAFLKGKPRREVLELLELNSRTPRLNRAIATALCGAALATPAAAPAAAEPAVTVPQLEGEASFATLTLRVQIRQQGRRLAVSFPGLPPPAQTPWNATRAITTDAVAGALGAALRLNARDAAAVHRSIDLDLPEDTLLSSVRRRPAGWARAMTGGAIFQAICGALGRQGEKRPDRDPHFDAVSGRLLPARADYIRNLERGA